MNRPGANEILIRNTERNSWFRFAAPLRVLSAMSHADVLPLLREVEEAVERHGLSAAGFIAYEAAPAFDGTLAARPSDGFPLAWFLLTPSHTEFEDPGHSEPPGGSEGLSWEASVTGEEYRAAVREIRNRIAEGVTYQVNYSYRLRSVFSGDAFALFQRMTGAQPTPYGAYLDTGRYAICSASPELFFSLNGRTVTARPMKGTSPRGLTNRDDRERGEQLLRSEKDRAENVMIVDMMRNDIGRVARSGTVRVTGLCALEKYPTVWQLTSTVEAQTDEGLTGLLLALFPAASITGAPKRSTMEIIRDLESTPRRIYTGAIGTVFPGRKASFSVAIRTALVDRDAGLAEYGVGGGIVWKSTEEGEWEESRIKALVISQAVPEFSLLETMLWKPGEGYLYLEDHLARIGESADYFSFPFDRESACRHLNLLAASLNPIPHKIRLLVRGTGGITTESEPWIPPGKDHLPVVTFSRSPVDSSDRFLYHKTTNRLVYERARSEAGDCDDVVLWNERGEITESSVANIAAEIDRVLLTPPTRSGLLAGIFRQRMLREGTVREGLLTRPDLARATRVFLMNSVRGMYEVKILRAEF